VADDRNIVLDAWIAVEELVAPAENENSGVEKDEQGEGECDAQGRQASRFYYRQDTETVRAHEKRLRTASVFSMTPWMDLRVLPKEEGQVPLRRELAVGNVQTGNFDKVTAERGRRDLPSPADNSRDEKEAFIIGVSYCP
jgi:hypothetical protein